MNKDTTFTIGLDLGDRSSRYALFRGDEPEPREEGRVSTTREEMIETFGLKPQATIALEVGTHSAWVSELLEGLGHIVIVANPRKVRAISSSVKKTDKTDAEMLARLARSDPKLLAPIQHRGPKCRNAQAVLRARDAAVRIRSLAVNVIRSLVKSAGGRMPSSSTAAFQTHADKIPEELNDALNPLMDVIRTVTEVVRGYDRTVDAMTTTDFPDAERLKALNGVGSLTALAFVTTVEDPHRFERSRELGSFLGVVPRLDQSGGHDPQLRITKAGSGYLRRLLVSSAQYILSSKGTDSDIRRWGLKLVARGGRGAKKRAAVAMARKLAVLLHRIWVTGAPYDPLRNSRKRAKNTISEEDLRREEEMKQLFGKKRKAA